MMEAIREALEDCAGLFVLADGIQSFEDFEGGEPCLGTLQNLQAIKKASLKAKKAIAELEKSAEDVELDDSVSDIISSAWDWEVGTDYIEAILQQYAESYHAKKCAECKALMVTDDVSDREA